VFLLLVLLLQRRCEAPLVREANNLSIFATCDISCLCCCYEEKETLFCFVFFFVCVCVW
jgi:hypothetical protein